MQYRGAFRNWVHCCFFSPTSGMFLVSTVLRFDDGLQFSGIGWHDIVRWHFYPLVAWIEVGIEPCQIKGIMPGWYYQVDVDDTQWGCFAGKIWFSVVIDLGWEAHPPHPPALQLYTGSCEVHPFGIRVKEDLPPIWISRVITEPLPKTVAGSSPLKKCVLGMGDSSGFLLG